MNPNEYQTLALVTCKAMPSKELDLMHALTGIHSEGGEIASTLKKHIIYGQPLNVENIKEEIGDAFWYFALLAKLCGLTLEEVMIHNVEKLKKRYPEGYSNAAAAARADKVLYTPMRCFSRDGTLMLFCSDKNVDFGSLDNGITWKRAHNLNRIKIIEDSYIPQGPLAECSKDVFAEIVVKFNEWQRSQ